MASFQTPQVDHNLYAPVMPQTNVAEIFQLMNAKQSIYNSNLARINNQRNSMYDLESAVTNDGVREKVSSFNKRADESLRKYASLDFSISDNSKLVDNLYDPLMKDQDFLTDYNTTSKNRADVQKLLALRDSTKKEDREAFSLTNLEYLTNPLHDLKAAKNPKELQAAAGNVARREFSPYVDVSANVLSRLKELGASVEYDVASGGYIVKTKKDSIGLEKFLSLTLSDQDKQQMRVEATVAVDRMIRSQGKEALSSQYIEDSLSSTDILTRRYTTAKAEIETMIMALPSEDKMSNAEREKFNLLTDKLENISSTIGKLNNQKATVSSIGKKLKEGTFSYDDLTEMIIADVTEEQIKAFTSGIAETYTDSKYTGKVETDHTYVAKQRLGFDYTKLAQDREIEVAKLEMEAIKNQTALKIAGFKYDGEGKIVSDYENVSTSVTPLENLDYIIANKGGIAEIQPYLEEDFKRQWELGNNHGNPLDWRKPELQKVLKHFSDPEYSIQHWDKKYQDLRSKYYGEAQEQINSYKMAKEDKQKYIDEFNKANNTNLYLDKNGVVTEKAVESVASMVATDLWASIKSPYYLLKFMAMNSVNPNLAKPYLADVIDPGWSKPGELKTTSENIEKFKQYVNKDNLRYGDIYRRQGVSAKGEAGNNLYNSVRGEFVEFMNSPTSIKGINPNLKDEELVIQGLRILDGVDKKDFHRTVQFDSPERGTLVAYPSVEIKDVFTPDKDGNYTEQQVSAFNQLKQGVRLPLVHNQYSRFSPVEAKYNNKSAILAGNTFKISINPASTDPEKDGVVMLPKTSGDVHYMYNFMEGDMNFPVVQDETGVWKLVPSKEKFYVPKSVVDKYVRSGKVDNLVMPFEARTHEVETTPWQSTLTEKIKDNPKLLIKKGDQYYISLATAKTLLTQ